jgi:C4-dicarboxylate-specific signal transduction histidine kinase
MVDKPDTNPEVGLQFFGRISASISHELKNVLAIINENAGLLEDFAFMADRGKPIDPARLKSMAAAVQKQVSRADLILKNMNRFAHSIDETSTDVDLNQILELVITLTERFAAMQQVEVDLQLPPESPTITTAPFYLINLVCLCLDFSMSAVTDEKRLELTIAEAEDSVLIHFSRLAGLTPELLQTFPTDAEKKLMAVLAADLTAQPGGEKISLRLPNNLE